MSLKFRVNDEVIVIVGKDKGKVGKIKKVFINLNKVIVENLNLVFKHNKSRPENNIFGNISRKESLLDISNISHFIPYSNKLSKVGFRYQNKKKVRYLKRNNVNI